MNTIPIKYLQSQAKLIQEVGLGCSFSSDCNSSDHKTLTRLLVNNFQLPRRLQVLFAQDANQNINILFFIIKLLLPSP